MIRERTNWHGYAASEELPLKVGETVRMSATGIVPSSTASMRIDIEFLTSSSFLGQVAIRHVKLEKGNKATDWCMSDGDINKRIQAQADALTAYQAEVKRTYALSSSVYTKTETQTRENNLRNSTISDLKGTDDWKKLIKINQNSSWLQDATGFQQQVWKYNLDSSSELIGKKSFENGKAGDWRCGDLKTPAQFVEDNAAYGFRNYIRTTSQSIGDLYYYGNGWVSVRPGDKFYVEILVPNFSGVYNNLNITVIAYLRYEQNGKTCCLMST
ncbi:hypothetical protein [Ligilactobacillus sp.]|uniref:hypothetical protein n=1 Tax=Ligilactobacillus sp. TaxID=2767921 RepID=UPI002FDF5391